MNGRMDGRTDERTDGRGGNAARRRGSAAVREGARQRSSEAARKGVCLAFCWLWPASRAERVRQGLAFPRHKKGRRPRQPGD